MMTDNGMDDFVIEAAETPCQDCFITFIQAGLEYPNGSYANANTSLWLHHTVLFNMNQTDTVCSNETDPQWQRWFASGNERTAFDLSVNGYALSHPMFYSLLDPYYDFFTTHLTSKHQLITNTNSTIKAGYYISPTDQIAFLAELMNQAMFTQEAVVTITFSYILSSPSTSSFIHATPVWLDIGGCDSSDLPAFANTTFNYTSSPWRSTIAGRVLAACGHVHDGGTNIKILSGNRTIGGCDLVAKYGETPGFIDGPNSMEMGGMSGGGEMQYMGMHVSSIEMCKGMEIKKGDELGVEAMYDTRKYAPMMEESGLLDDIMGISLMYVA